MKRIATAIVGIPATLVLILYSPDWLFALVVALVAAVCFEELLSMASLRIDHRPGRLMLVVGVLVTLSFAGGPGPALAGIAGGVLLVSAVITFSVSLEQVLPKMALSVFGILYCCTLLAFIILLPAAMRVVLLGVVWVGDGAAYYGGRTLGRHFLAPGISPKKTVEGAFAGLVGSMIAGVIIGVLMTEESSGRLLAGAFLAGAAGQVGDLFESALKRSAGVKDSSALLPGHGGMLDRLDGVLFAAPVFYWFFSI